MATDELAEHVGGPAAGSVGVLSSGTWPAMRTWLCRGGRSCGRCDGSRPGGWSGADGSSPVLLASSTLSLKRWTSYVTSGAASGRAMLVRLSAADPLNLSGVILPGKRVPALRTNSLLFRDGLIAPVDGGGSDDGGSDAADSDNSSSDNSTSDDGTSDVAVPAAQAETSPVG